MRTEYLEFLIEISKTNSMSLAAKNLYISPQGINTAINKLEDELGLALLYRTNNGVTLTQEGKKLVDWATNFLNDLNKIKDKKINEQTETNDLTGNLSVYTVPLFAPLILPKAVVNFNKKYPKVTVKIEEMDYGDVLTGVAEKKADIGLVTLIKSYVKNILDDLNISNSVIIKELFSDRLYVQIGKSSTLASKESVSISEALMYPLAVYTWAHKYLIDYLETSSYRYGKPSIAIESQTHHACQSTIEQGQTIGFTTGYMVKNFIALNNCLAIPISDNIEIVDGLVINCQSDLCQASQEFINILKTYCKF